MAPSPRKVIAARKGRRKFVQKYDLRHKLERAAQWDGKSFLELSFNGIQALSTFSVLGLTIWAVFFSSLPETLERQLRTEIISANEEAISARQTNLRLQREQEALIERGRFLTEEASNLEIQIKKLALERAALEETITRLSAERSQYAQNTTELVVQQVVAVAEYELTLMEVVANISSDYRLHLNWLDAQRELAEIEDEWESQSFSERFGDENPLRQKRAELMSHELPKYWFNIPQEPNLSPAQKSGAKVTEHDIVLITANEDFERAHSYLINKLFSWVVKSENVKPITSRAFVKHVIAYDMIQGLLPEEKSRLVSQIEDFVSEHPEMMETNISVYFDVEPSAEQLIESGREVTPKIASFKKAFLEHLRQIENYGDELRW